MPAKPGKVGLVPAEERPGGSYLRRMSHHRELHRDGDEAAWWSGLNIDPVPVAFELWRSTHRDGAFRNPAGAGAQSAVATFGGVSLIESASR
jgi:hypothetical protein